MTNEPGQVAKYLLVLYVNWFLFLDLQTLSGPTSKIPKSGVVAIHADHDDVDMAEKRL